MAWGDLIARLMGEQDPSAQLAAALGQGPGQPGGGPGGVATPGAAAAPQALPQGPMPNGQPVPAPPQPAAYTSPPDLVSLYTKLQDRQERNAAIDRGAGLLFSAFAQPQNRAAMIASMAPKMQQDPAEGMGNLMKLTATQQALQQKAQMRANLPQIAKKYGLDLETATYLFDSGGLDNYIQQASKPDVPSANRKDYLDYKSDQEAMQKPVKTFEEWMASENKAREKWSLVPQFVDSGEVDEGGNPVLKSVLTSDAGNVKDITDSEGKPLLRKASKIETDTTVEYRDPMTGALIKTVPKNVKAGAKEKAAGDAEGKAQAMAETSLANAENMTSVAFKALDDIEDSPALNDEWFKGGGLGAAGVVMRKIPGTDAYGLDATIQQAKAKAFDDAYQSLKGTGSITEIEGQKAEAARQRLDAAQNPRDFRKALRDYREVLVNGLRIARKRAKGDFSEGVPPEDLEKQLEKNKEPDAPGPDEDDELIKKYGG